MWNLVKYFAVQVLLGISKGIQRRKSAYPFNWPNPRDPTISIVGST